MQFKSKINLNKLFLLFRFLSNSTKSTIDFVFLIKLKVIELYNNRKLNNL
jgi:hypothetical protein